MKFKIMNLVNSTWIRIVISISVIFLITFYWAYRANIFSISDWLQFFIFWALVVVSVLAFYDLIHGERDRAEQKKANELRKIDEQLLEIYKPLEVAIIDFQKIMIIDKSKEPILIRNHSVLETAIRTIKSKTTHEIDSRINNMQIVFFGTPTTDKLNNNFLNSVQIKITELENERKKYK